jgi:hypothetical protein
LDNIYKLHGLPKAIISDRDPIFTSTVWKELFKLTDTQLMMSSAYHPQTDGQTERLNQCLEGFLICTVHSCPRQWSKWLSIAEFWYNTTHHSALGASPFQAKLKTAGYYKFKSMHHPGFGTVDEGHGAVHKGYLATFAEGSIENEISG